jgi:Zn-dependent peptidase ImmA (M78 family)
MGASPKSIPKAPGPVLQKAPHPEHEGQMNADVDSSIIEEIEANEFAIALLLPEDQVRKYLDEHPGVARAEDEAFRRMARRFAVPLIALGIRLADLRRK